MSEQIREQISAFLDGELPSAESELLLKRLLRDPQLRDSFGRYALIGEAMRGTKHMPLSRDLTGAINSAIDAGQARPAAKADPGPARRWWRSLAGAAVAASVAIVGVVALQQRTNVTVGPSTTVATLSAPGASAATATAMVTEPVVARNREAQSYTVPNNSSAAPNAIPRAMLTSYVFAHSQYSSLLGQRDVMTDLIADVDQPNPEADASVAR
ncbi:MAG: sigma-E factor negative regulatory protein [Steroidobacterales bacterium]